MLRLLVVLTFVWYSSSTDAPLSCAVCTNVTSLAGCNTTKLCGSTERCYTTSYGVGSETVFDFGCKSEADCLGPSAGLSVVGRATDTTSRCSQCCAVDNCNQHLCSAGTQVTHEVGHCADDPTFDCKHFSTLFNICSDVVHAKTACRRWCGLCNLVDGAWSSWSSWSQCDVTCGIGHVTRQRSCSDPAPAHGGLYCSGNNNETNICTLSPCPVHGGWSVWNDWTSCSNSCGLGTQSRHRLCNNPVPQLAGNHCFGDGVDFKACFIRSCVDGVWSAWSQWTPCINGTTTRIRECNNPQPSKFGRECLGNNRDWKTCGSTGSTDGGYVAFTVTAANTTTVNNHPIFTHIITNVGGAYNPQTAIFTCPIAGLYQFSLTIASHGKPLYCWLQKNNVDTLFAGGSTVGDHDYNMSTANMYVDLDVGDKVTAGSCSHWSDAETGHASSFSGVLIHPRV